MPNPDPKWWKDAVCYQVWPASFKDSNGDGLGDIPGVISKLDYLKSLGIDCIWLSPMYDSPRHDQGYDIRDYKNVDPAFGSLNDMDDLIKGVHNRGMRIILDLVVNHTSNEHMWFRESAKSRDNPYSDFYIWRDPKVVDGKICPPTNWASIFFGGSAWKYVEARDQYYFHLFLDSQPDLNWENEEVRKAIYESAIKFWLDRGVDGFRVDAVNVYSKNLESDAPITDPKDEFQFPDFKDVANGPKMHEWLEEQRREALGRYGGEKDIVLVGELGFSTDEQFFAYIDPKKRMLDMVFDWGVLLAEDEMMTPWTERRTEFSLKAFRHGLSRPQKAISDFGCWSTVFLENHDQQRSVIKFGSRKAEYRWQSARLLTMLLCTLSGTLFIYQGQEIGMSGVPRDWPLSDLNDPWWLSYIKDMERKHPGDEVMKQKVLDAFHRDGRDHARTPVQWSSEEPYAGFSTSKPWLRVNENFRDGVNVKAQEGDLDSCLSFWKKCIAFRKEHKDLLTYGHTEWLDKDNEKVFLYLKHSPNDETTMLVVLNFTDNGQEWQMPEEFSTRTSEVVMTTGKSNSQGSRELEPWEGIAMSFK